MRRFIVTLLSFILLSPAAAGAISISGSQDCDTNAVIRCGLSSSSAMSQSYQQTGVSEVFSCFGISQSDINNFDSEAVAGRVTSTGKVIVNGRTVALDAMTAGRQNMTGSTAISCGGTTFYKRSPSISFQSTSLPAYVVMRNGQFSYAIIASCGNPVMATPVAQPKPKVKAAVTPAPAVQPPAAPQQTQTQSQSQSVTVNQPAATPVASPAPTPAPAPTQAAPAPAALPNTGPGPLAGLAGLTTILSTAGHFIYTRRKFI